EMLLLYPRWLGGSCLCLLLTLVHLLISMWLSAGISWPYGCFWRILVCRRHSVLFEFLLLSSSGQSNPDKCWLKGVILRRLAGFQCLFPHMLHLSLLRLLRISLLA